MIERHSSEEQKQRTNHFKMHGTQDTYMQISHQINATEDKSIRYPTELSRDINIYH